MTSTTAPANASSAHPRLDPGQVDRFLELGYHILPGFLPPGLQERLRLEVDQALREQQHPFDPYASPGAKDQQRRKLPLEYHEHGLLISHPPLMDILTDLMGPGFVFHHLHTARHDAGCKGVSWHHDYEQIPQTNRSHVMVHVFYYISGLNGEIGDLLVLPRSQHMVMANGTMGMFGTESTPGTVVIDNLPPGSAVIVHSAVSHARRPKPGGEGRPRYFIDASYCQAGQRWPSTYGDWRFGLRRARELGLDRQGVYAHLFEDDRFFDSDAARKAFETMNHGSMYLRLPEAGST